MWESTDPPSARAPRSVFFPVYSTRMPIRLYATLLAALLGLAFGSFLNVCLTRWPLGESILKPRSHCRACGRTLAWWENLPLVSWLALRGRCRTCGAWIGWRYPLVELTVGVLWGLIWWRLIPELQDRRFGIPSQYALPYFRLEYSIGIMLLLWVLVGLAVLDAEHLWLPDAITLPGIAIGLGFSALLAEQMGWFFTMEPTPRKDLGERLLAIALAALLVLLIRWTYKLLRKREGIGLGDAKLMAMLAAWLGLAGALLSFFIGAILGALTALILLALPRTKAEAPGRDEERVNDSKIETPSWALRKLPLGTFLCIGGIVSALWGQPILAAYLRWAGF
jgi:leader peptidase (prepilin peptidase) / N-methyltransferase